MHSAMDFLKETTSRARCLYQGVGSILFHTFWHYLYLRSLLGFIRLKRIAQRYLFVGWWVLRWYYCGRVEVIENYSKGKLCVFHVIGWTFTIRNDFVLLQATILISWCGVWYDKVEIYDSRSDWLIVT
jgi:hypothetical protein